MNVDRSSLSPMMMQYFEVKDKYPDHIVFFRLGDFYEMFFDDAVTVSRALELTLTGRDCGQAERAPMCGIPYHSAEIYIKKLIDLGFRVAICEQMEDPKLAKGIVKRDVIRIVTPGTLTESNLLDDSKNNFIGALYVHEGNAAICFADISTGTAELFTHKDKTAPELTEALINEISRFSPAELLFNAEAADMTEVREFIRTRMNLGVTVMKEEDFSPVHSDVLLKQFSADSFTDIGIDERMPAPWLYCADFSTTSATPRGRLWADLPRYRPIPTSASWSLTLPQGATLSCARLCATKKSAEVCFGCLTAQRHLWASAC